MQMPQIKLGTKMPNFQFHKLGSVASKDKGGYSSAGA